MTTDRKRRFLLPAGLAVLLAAGLTAVVLLRDEGGDPVAGTATGAGTPGSSVPAAPSGTPGRTPPSSVPGSAVPSAPGPAAEPTAAPVRTKALPVNATGGGRYPARFSVGAPGVKRYKQSDARLPVPPGYKLVQAHNKESLEWDLYDCKGTVNLDRMYFRAFIYIGTSCHGKVNITNSIIAPPPGAQNRAILVNSDAKGSLELNLTNVTIRPEPAGLGEKSVPLNDHAINDCATCTITLNRVDVANTGGMCLCGARTTIRNSWLHDNYIANLSDPGQAHTGGVFPYGGSGPVTIENSRLEPGIDAYTGKPVANYWKAITAVLFTQQVDGSQLRGYSVRDSFISLGAYGLYAQTGVDLKITDNVFGPTHWDAAGGCDSNCSTTYGEWSNNVVGTIDGVPTTKQVPKPAR
ncbi:hypothetical protein [Actinoplanes utahensis]|uniref:Right handed beta helix domain-containing protein n=1 Tax=Actinoplanes utahensis TaxID=1869 RepID=A0A0A6UD19_ACTUT|nr:hypothetical protein [Actinoplanes utahensis]KHD73361.1 hypothetical protein MB27_34565 [Actinoplanes utahensis]GIF30107.1 hypothetical protein Aut01nite_30930 [Actinoplanes utahensis]